MSDRYASFAHSGTGRFFVKRLGLPDPPRLRRYRPGDSVLAGPVAVGGTGRLIAPVNKIIENLPKPPESDRNAALIFDATGIVDSGGLRSLYDFFHPVIRTLAPSGRVIVLGSPPELCANAREATAQRALEGFVRSVAKEVGRGTTAQLVYVAPGAEDAVESTLRFLLSGRSAYVSGQVVRIGPATVDVPEDWEQPLVGKTAIVTGAARGIGAAIAEVLTREGAHVVCLDVPAAGEDLTRVANDLKGTALQLDLTADDAPRRLADFIATRHVHADVFVHNAGITRDKTLGRMDVGQWQSVLDVNLASQERINDVLLAENLLGGNGRIVAVSSVSGIAGNRGQTNYATSKAGVIGIVEANAAAVAARGLTLNAVAPGFIETKMTAAMPMFIREAGRRMNSMSQGGLPVDVAETIAWLANPASGGVSGNIIRVCGQSLLGA
ncbi:3-oxoacyl-ACP reductase [Dactylosporangium sp. AC04546]|uniref:3-oxoacyl-ACP reductase n=1 Tax=Dactylosporangium sp. AC04546 TaxID=2862460 RepID=UPI001EE0461B|nr:3-oxoacyl-ACP reductase [Dactylosporangium sp. AC04546]WVK83585.1 3-oxoacyl-ACP reductase [Dactylosporangium sp. AC04546]